MNEDRARYTKHFYEFGPFRLDATDHQLLRQGVPLSLKPKALDTLLVLVRNSGRTLEKDELMKAVWHDTIVEENNLTQHVSALRKVLGQDSRLIQTIPRRGYRFIAEVSERWEEIPTLIVRQHTRSSSIINHLVVRLGIPRLKNSTGAFSRGTLGQRLLRICKKPAVLTAGASVLLVAAIMGVSLLSVRRRVFPASPERTDGPRAIPPLARGGADGRGAIPPLRGASSLAVLPFRADGESRSLNYVAEGLRETISDKLIQLGDIRVVSVRPVPEMSRRKPVAVLVKDLGVNLAVAGSVQEAGDKLHVVVSLEEVASDRQVWTREFAGSRRYLLGLEEQILASLVRALCLPSNDRDLAQLRVHPTENGEAYDLYLRGREIIRNFKDVKHIEDAMQLYQQALSMDPGFALAYAGLADASLEMYEQNDEKLWADKAIHAAQEALRQAPTSAEAHLALGSAKYATGYFDQAVTELQRGLQLASNSDEGYRRLGSVYLEEGRTEEARRAYEKAIRLSPFYPADYQTLGDAYLSLGENDKALAAFQELADLAPRDAVAYEDIGLVYFRQGQWSQSIPSFQKALAISPYYQTYSNLGTAYFYLKQYDDAVKMFEKAVELDPNEELCVGNLADAYHWSGNQDKALTIYDQAIKLTVQELQANPRDASAIGNLALYHAKEGDVGLALEFIRRGRSIDPIDAGLLYTEAVVQNLAGHQQKALEALSEALQKGYSPQEARDDPELATLQRLPAFAQLFHE